MLTRLLSDALSTFRSMCFSVAPGSLAGPSSWGESQRELTALLSIRSETQHPPCISIFLMQSSMWAGYCWPLMRYGLWIEGRHNTSSQLTKQEAGVRAVAGLCLNSNKQGNKQIA